MLRILPLFALVAVAQCICAAAFQPSSTPIKRSSAVGLTRREVVEAGAISSIAAIVTLTTSFVLISPKDALASGGATAGGAYLLSVRLGENDLIWYTLGELKLKIGTFFHFHSHEGKATV
jgi:hypothetical protein